MNYLSELIFGKKTEPPEWENIKTHEPKVIEKHCLYYRPYSYSGMTPFGWWQDEQIAEFKIQGINNNQTHYSSTFPDFNEKIFDTEHYEQVIYNLEQKYTDKAINNNNNIEIIKRIKPETFNYNDKDYDFSRYEFVVCITE